MLSTGYLSRVKHWFYQLQGARHARRWRDFSSQNTSAPRFAITLFVRNHPGAAQDDIIDHLMTVREYAERENCAVVVQRNLRDMEADGQLESREQRYYSSHQVKFVIRQETPWFSWFFLVSVGLAMAAFAVTLTMVPATIHTAFVILLLLVMFFRIIDDVLHNTPW